MWRRRPRQARDYARSGATGAPLRPFPSSGATAGASIEATTSAVVAGGFLARFPSRPARLRPPPAFFLVPVAFFLVPVDFFFVVFFVVFRARLAGPRDSRSRSSATGSSRLAVLRLVPSGVV